MYDFVHMCAAMCTDFQLTSPKVMYYRRSKYRYVTVQLYGRSYRTRLTKPMISAYSDSLKSRRACHSCNNVLQSPVRGHTMIGGHSISNEQARCIRHSKRANTAMRTYSAFYRPRICRQATLYFQVVQVVSQAKHLTPPDSTLRAISNHVR